MNVPNQLTCLRFVLAIVFLALLGMAGVAYKAAALVVFLVASWTDWLDGHLARRDNQITKFGKVMDPMADKFLTVAAFVMFVQLGLVAAWSVVMILMRDLFVTAVRATAGPEDAGARLSGKQKTALQFLFIVCVLVFLTWRESGSWPAEWTAGAFTAIHAGMALIVAITLYSGALYVLKNRSTIFS
jgi:CDP-diacylglycerol--glycerol-3-phosphate 3-phosphatidyltransferase